MASLAEVEAATEFCTGCLGVDGVHCVDVEGDVEGGGAVVLGVGGGYWV